MAHDPVPDDVRELIQHHIDSVAQLEALLFLRANSGEGWDVSTIARRLYAPEAEIARSVEKLRASGFLRYNDSVYRYECTEELREKVDRLAAAYRQFLIPITNQIHAKSRTIREFSDAFRFRRDR